MWHAPLTQVNARALLLYLFGTVDFNGKNGLRVRNDVFSWI